MSQQDDGSDGRNRKAILARRARFMAAALASVTGCKDLGPEPCLSVARPPEPELPRRPPAPCLSVPPERAPDDRPPPPSAEPCLKIAGPRAEPCLDIAPPRADPCLKIAPPRVCLSVVVPRDPSKTADAGAAAEPGPCLAKAPRPKKHQ